jgi:hypothetical protein
MSKQHDPFAHWEAILYALLGIVALTALAFGLSGCVSKRACERRWGPCGQGYVEVQTKSVPWTINVPGASVDTRIPLWQAAYTELRHDTLTYTDSTGRARLIIALDSLGNLYAQCQALPMRIDTNVVEVTRTERIVTTETETQTPWWNWAAISALTALLLALLVKHVFG